MMNPLISFLLIFGLGQTSLAYSSPTEDLNSKVKNQQDTDAPAVPLASILQELCQQAPGADAASLTEETSALCADMVVGEALIEDTEVADRFDRRRDRRKRRRARDRRHDRHHDRRNHRRCIPNYVNCRLEPAIIFGRKVRVRFQTTCIEVGCGRSRKVIVD